MVLLMTAAAEYDDCSKEHPVVVSRDKWLESTYAVSLSTHGRPFQTICPHSNSLLCLQLSGSRLTGSSSTAPKWRHKTAPTNWQGLGHLSSPEAALFMCCSWGTDKWSIYHQAEIKQCGDRLGWEDGKLVEHRPHHCSDEQFCTTVSFLSKKRNRWCSNSTLRSLPGENLVKGRKIHAHDTGNSSGSNAEMNSQYLFG